MDNRNLNTISIADVLRVLQKFASEKRDDVSLEHMFSFASELTGISVDALSSATHLEQLIDFEKVVFRDYDDTGMPLQFFFGYEITPEQRQSLVSSWGYRGDLCTDVEFCLDLYTLNTCPLEAVLTFSDHEQRWVDLLEQGDYLKPFLDIVNRAGTERAQEALKLLEEIPANELYETSVTDTSGINREKLTGYLENEMIMEFGSAEECLEYFNTYDSQAFQSVDEMKEYQGKYGFGIDEKWYHISFDEALDVWEKPSLSSQIQSGIKRASQSHGVDKGTAAEKGLDF